MFKKYLQNPAYGCSELVRLSNIVIESRNLFILAIFYKNKYNRQSRNNNEVEIKNEKKQTKQKRVYSRKVLQIKSVMDIYCI